VKPFAKRLVVVLALLFAVSSVAAAININNASVALRGRNIWINGSRTNAEYTDSRTIIFTSSGTGWSARAEFTGATVAIGKFNFQTDEAPFRLNVWGRGHSLSHYGTPFTWVRQTNAAHASNWKARLTFQLLEGETVFGIDNDTSTYYLFYKKAFGDTQLGAAHKTNFKHTTSSAVYAITKVPGVTITGEVAADGKWDAGSAGTKLEPKYGLQGVFDFGLTLKGTYTTGNKQLMVEAIQLMKDNLSRYYGKYTDTNGTKEIIGEVHFRAKNDQAITNIWGTTGNWWQYATANWTKNTGWAVGAKATRKVDNNLALVLNGFYEFVPGTVRSLATVNYTSYDSGADPTWNATVRGWYKVNNKFFILPQVDVDQTWIKAGTYFDYQINTGRVYAGAFYEMHRDDETKSQERFELGWQLGL
jgi:hypothetical protein